MRRLLLALGAAIGLAASDAPAQQAETRVALIIANEAYTSPSLGRLPGTQRDASLMEAALRNAGFEVTVARNVGRAQMRDAIMGFARRLGQLGQDGVGFFYYSGHGIADDPRGRNYLVPVDAQVSSVTDLPIVALSLNEQLDSIELAHARATVVVIDACRNTPISFGRGGRGLAPVSATTDTLIAFSTQPGEIAADDGVYARVLSEELVRPGVRISQAFDVVQTRVSEATQRRQRPRYDNGLVTPVVFVVDAAIPIENVATSSPLPTNNPSPLSAAVGLWEKDTGAGWWCNRYYEYRLDGAGLARRTSRSNPPSPSSRFYPIEVLSATDGEISFRYNPVSAARIVFDQPAHMIHRLPDGTGPCPYHRVVRSEP